MNKAIEVNNLTKYYGGLLAVDEINFEVEEGEIFGFLGPNGAGKTTTQRMLTTLLEPTSGQIRIHGHDLARDPYPAKRVMGLVPEESNVYTELTAWENLVFTARLYRVPVEKRQPRAHELLEAFGLWEKRDVKVEDFSKGMQRRLSIAMAIIHQPRLLFLDEPTPGLDAQSARTIRDLVREMNAAGTTVFLTTHQIEEANQLCDRVAIINHGKIAAIDTPEKLKTTFQRVQSVEVSFASNGGGVEESLQNLPHVSKIVKRGDKWRMYTEDPPSLLLQVTDLSRNQNREIVSLNTLSPSLEDVFLEITGQEIGTIRHEQQKNDKQARGGRRR
ncbi:MAG: ATP-binding cassette domain-containing protein [Anaerolineales bacterium]